MCMQKQCKTYIYTNGEEEKNCYNIIQNKDNVEQKYAHRIVNI